MRERLDPLYRATEYRVLAGSQLISLVIDRQDPRNETALAESSGDYRQWAIITPCNPASVALCQQENAALLENFHHWLRHKSYRWLPSLNHDPDGHWPDEPGALIFDIERNDAEALGRQFGQNAIVHALRGHAPQLVWLRKNKNATGQTGLTGKNFSW